MSKSTGHKKIKPNDRVIFCHVATGNKPMTGTVIEVRPGKNSKTYVVQDDKQQRFYPGVGDGKHGKIIEKISCK